MHAILRRSRMENEMDAELRFHIETYAEDLIRGGVPRSEAMRRARVEFGAIERAKDECRDARGPNLVESLTQDLRYALQTARRRSCLGRPRALSSRRTDLLQHRASRIPL